MHKNIILILPFFLFQFKVLYSQWTSVSNGLDSYANTVLYNDNSNLFGGNYSGFFISTNNGVKWNPTALTDNVRAVLVNGNTIFAGGEGMNVSTDYGQTFSQTISSFQSIMDIENSNGNVYAAAVYSGFYLSSNNGASWVNRQVNFRNCLNLEIKNSFLFAGCTGSLKQNNGGVLKSSDNGITWSETPLINVDINFLESNSSYLFAGNSDSLLRSNDNGNLWTRMVFPASPFTIKRIFMLEESLFVCGSNSLGNVTYVSNDNGSSWNLFNLSGDLISVVKKSGTLVASVNYRGVYISFDNASTWDQYLHRDLSVNAFYKRNNRLFAGTSRGMYASEDNGLNWKRLNSTGSSVLSITSNDAYLFTSSYAGEISRSSDNGVSWETPTVFGGYVNAIYYFNNRLFTDNSYAGIRYSSDNGVSWSSFSIPGSVTYCFADYDNKLFAGLFSQGIYYSTNSGDSWSPTNLNAGSMSQIMSNSQYMFVASLHDPGLYRSSDGGINWDKTDLNHLSWSLLVSGDVVIAGTGSAGVYISTDNGVSWRSRNENLGSNNVHSLFLDNDYVFSGLFEAGIYRTTLSSLTKVVQQYHNIPENFILYQNYPNPFNPTTIISFDISKRSFVNLTVYNATGKLVNKLINEYKSPGNTEIAFESNDLPSGVYYYTLTTDGITQSRKMILLR